MTVVIIEDEAQTRSALTKLLGLLSDDVEIVGEAGTVETGRRLVNTLSPDVLFLDVQLEDGTGFDILDGTPSWSGQLIFTTGNGEHALRAFQCSAIDFLLKPIDPKQLKAALDKARIAVKKEENYQWMLNTLRDNFEGPPKKLVIKTNHEHLVLTIEEIIRLQADGSYTAFFVKDQRIVVSKNLKHYERLLRDTFLRCHQSHLVNPSYVKSMKKGVLHLANGENIPVAARKTKDVRSFLKL